MSNMTVFDTNQLPDYLRNIGDDETTKNLAGGGSDSRRISIKGGIFRMIVGGKEVAKNEDRSMDVVIVKAAEKVSRIYYKGKYNPDDAGKAPDCWSSDGQRPDPAVKEPMGATCAVCPMNIAGSGHGNSRACRFQQRLAVVLGGDIGGDVYQLALPATSIFGDANGSKMPLHAYGRFLAGHGVPVTAVITEMRFDTDVETPKLTFKAKRALTEEEYNVSKSQGATPEAASAVTMLVPVRDGTDKEHEKPASAQAAAPAPAPAAEGPTVRKAKPETPPVSSTAPSIEDVLSSWDTDDGN